MTLQVSWHPPICSNGNISAYWLLYREENGDEGNITQWTRRRLNGSLKTQHILHGLDSSKSYIVCVAVQNEQGISEVSNKVGFNALPTRSDNMKCTMGDISLEVGATLKLNDRNCDTKCSCLTPPEFTCVKHRNCDLSKEEQSQPMISVRRGNLDCPPVTCNEGCATLTDLRTGCQFCSCGADVVTCPELSCHESCHRVQDTKSGCPRCECNCPKDPLGNPPCPKDCAIHFVKDQATGCEKCECNPSNPGGPFGNPNLPPRKEVCRINPLTGRAHCPMDCAVIYRISPETGCEECKCDPNSSSSPFPRPVPIPTRPNN